MALRTTTSSRDIVDPFESFLTPWEPFGWGFGPLTSNLLSSGGQAVKPFAPILSADLVESDTDYHVHLDLPGVDKGDLDISFSDGNMMIKAERKALNEITTDKVHRVERTSGRVQRVIALPKNASTSGAEANLRDGVLIITLPKTEPAPRSQKLLVK